MCVCVKERKRERKWVEKIDRYACVSALCVRASLRVCVSLCVFMFVSVFVCVCVYHVFLVYRVMFRRWIEPRTAWYIYIYIYLWHV